MLKKLIGVFMVFCLVLGLIACSSSANVETSSSATEPVTSTASTSEKTEATTEASTQVDFPELVMSFSNGSSPTSLCAEGMQIMKDHIEQMTGGKVTINFGWQNSLFTTDQELPAMMKGDLDLCNPDASWLAQYAPELYTLTGAFLFRDFDHFIKFYKGDIAKEMLDRVAEETGVRVLSVCFNGGRLINLNQDKKITSRADLKDVKLRMQNTDSWLFMGEALGANPIPISYADVYLALQTGTVDAQDNCLIAVKDNSYFEVTKSITLTNHAMGTGFYAIRESLWKTLSPELQAIIQEAADMNTDFLTNTILTQEKDIITFLEGKGMTIYNLTDEEHANYSKEVIDYYMAHPEVVDKWDMDLYNQIQSIN